MNIKSLFNIRRKSNPIDTVTRIEELHDTTWYLADALSSVLGKNGKIISNIDMASDRGKAVAMELCTPLSMVVGRLASMFANANIYVTDKNGNERRSYNNIRDLLNAPNPLQTSISFLKSVEKSLKLYGYCPIFMNRGAFGNVLAMYVIPVPIFHMVSSGKLFGQLELSEIIERVYIDWGGYRLDLADDDFFIIHNSEFRVLGGGLDIQFESVTDSLSRPVNNWIVTNAASCRLISNGGPKGVLYNNHVDELNSRSMTPEEKNDIETKLRDKYGLLNKFPILVSPISLGWIPFDFNSDQLKLLENDKRCEEKISNALGVNYSLFSEAKYENQENAKKAVYQDIIIPDANNVAQALTKALCPDEAVIKFDYSHIDCLQKDKAKSATVLKETANALTSLFNVGFISAEEARMHLSDYMDIDPNNIVGQLKQTNNGTEK